jgi:hypothetical protein
MFLRPITETNDAQRQIEAKPWDAGKMNADENVHQQSEAEPMQTIEAAPIEPVYKKPVYKPLNDGAFTVLIIHPGTGDELLQTTHEHRTSFWGGEYEALSYAWGDRHRTYLIRESNSEVHITQNLHEALLRLRLKDQPRTIWVDAICINQDDGIEKGIQVQMMQQIYANALQVIVWLGEESDHGKSASAFSDINIVSPFLGTAGEHVDMDLEISFKSATSKANWQGDLWTGSFYEAPRELQESLEPLANLLCRDWFCPTWVVQEVASSKKTILMGRGNTMPWESFAAVCLKYQYHQRAIRQLEKSYRGHDFGL